MPTPIDRHLTIASSTPEELGNGADADLYASKERPEDAAEAISRCLEFIQCEAAAIGMSEVVLLLKRASKEASVFAELRSSDI